MVELVDTYALGAYIERCESSSLSIRTSINQHKQKMNKVQALEGTASRMFHQGDIPYSQYFKLQEYLRTHEEEINSSTVNVQTLFVSVLQKSHTFEVLEEKPKEVKEEPKAKVKRGPKLEMKEVDLDDLDFKLVNVEEHPVEFRNAAFGERIQIDPAFQEAVLQAWDRL